MTKRRLPSSVIAFSCVLGAMSLFSSSALAVGPPEVSFGTDSDHSLNTLMVSGNINTNGSATTYKFEYGKSKLYGQFDQKH